MKRPFFLQTMHAGGEKTVLADGGRNWRDDGRRRGIGKENHEESRVLPLDDLIRSERFTGNNGDNLQSKFHEICCRYSTCLEDSF